MENHTAPGVLHVKALAHPCGKYNGEFQSLALVDAHDADCIRLFIHDPGFPVVHVIFLKLSDIPHKIKQSLIAGPLKRGCLFHQHVHIRRSLGPAGHCSHRKPKTRSLNDLRKELMHRSIRHLSPKICHLVKKPSQLPAQRLSNLPAFIPAILASLRIGRDRFIERLVRECSPDLCHFL